MHPTTLSPRSSTTPARRPSRLRKLLGTHAEGQGLVEYALLLVFIATVAIGAVTLFGAKTSTTYSRVTTKIDCTVNSTHPSCTAASGGNNGGGNNGGNNGGGNNGGNNGGGNNGGGNNGGGNNGGGNNGGGNNGGGNNGGGNNGGGNNGGGNKP